MSQNDVPTQQIKKTVRVSEDTYAAIRLGTLVAILVACCTASVWLWQIKDNGDRTAATVKDIQQSLVPYTQKVDQLWWEHHLSSNPKRPGRSDD